MNGRRLLAAILAATLTALPGCEFGRRYANRPWGKGTFIPAAVCAVVGAGAGAGIQEWRRGDSIAELRGPPTAQDPAGPIIERNHVRDSPHYWRGVLIGSAVGFVVCGLAAHYLFEAEPGTPTPTPSPIPTLTPTPTPEPLPPSTSKRIVLRGITFDFDKSDIRPDSRPVLDAAVRILKENPSLRISVEGHTDAIGSDQYNQQLSVRRAEAVFRYLVNHGIAPERMEVIGYGKSRPVADNETESGRAQNRRVELRIINENGAVR